VIYYTTLWEACQLEKAGNLRLKLKLRGGVFDCNPRAIRLDSKRNIVGVNASGFGFVPLNRGNASVTPRIVGNGSEPTVSKQNPRTLLKIVRPHRSHLSVMVGVIANHERDSTLNRFDRQRLFFCLLPSGIVDDGIFAPCVVTFHLAACSVEDMHRAMHPSMKASTRTSLNFVRHRFQKRRTLARLNVKREHSATLPVSVCGYYHKVS